ncbi:acyltransferase [Telmatobacter sp. DSM 110680]|uniref:Acyltransferase n=1 Tax=Telmatobacter sp. DSM 110680 TaxID=3036704 RepID=A0AAU7DHT1_9BACT
MNRIPSLDGWRGVAITLVLLEHIQGTMHRSIPGPWTNTGQHGVTIFFVLSGFLITTKLLEGPIDLKRFYLRRFFRLLPVVWVYLIVIWLFGKAIGIQTLTSTEVVSCLFIFRNFLGHLGQGLTASFWSLSIEEQFYLVWPCLLLLAGGRRARWFALAGALLCSGYRLLNWDFYNHLYLSFRTEVRADALLIGCLVSLLLNEPSFRPLACRWSKVLALPAGAIVLFCVTRFPYLPPLTESVAIAVLIVASVVHPNSLMARPLSFRPLAWLGTISYSLYVWNLFFFLISGSVLSEIVMMCLMFCFALASYYVIERPATRLGHRLTSIAGRPNPAQTELA